KTEAPVHLEAKNEQEFILLKSGKETHRLRFDHIYYLEGTGNYITYHTSSGKLLSLQTMKELEEELPRQFVRIHKSFIINIDHVDSFESHQVRIKGSDLPISQANREAFLKRVAKPI
ncbi:MAG TPA: LytTR family DNA-binding domain-containing protein, partial [Roseivirga sp.]